MKINHIFLMILTLIIILFLVFYFTMSENSEDYTVTKNSENVFSYKIKVNPGISINFDLEYHIIEATNNISDILAGKNITIPLDFEVSISGSPDGDIVAGASKRSQALYSGGTIYIYTDFVGNLSVSYTEVIMHEIIHIMGFGSSEKWRSAIIGFNLDGSKFPKSLEEYRKLKNDSSLTRIPIGGVSKGHWNESEFRDEMMTPSILRATNLILSKLTGYALDDIGWKINYESEQFEPYVLL